MRFWICLFFTWSLPTFLIAQNTFSLSDTSIIHNLDNYAEIFIDKTNRTTIQDITSDTFQKKFQKVTGKGISLGYIPHTVWAKINLKNLAPKSTWFLEIPTPILDTVTFYQKREQTWQARTCGYHFPQSAKPIPHTGFAFPIYFNNDTEQILYVRLAGTSPKMMPLRVMTKDIFFEKVRHEDVAYGILFGVFAIMFCYNLVIFFTLRDINYLLYVFTLIFTTSFIVTISGYGHRYLWADSPVMNFYAGRGALGCLGMAVSFFTISFLEVRKYSRIAYHTLWVIFFLSIGSLILTSTGIIPSAPNNLLSAAAPIFLVTGIFCWYKGNHIAKFYVTAWGFYMVGGIVATLRNSGVFGFNFWSTHLVEIGAGAETFLLALALSDKYRRYKRDKELAMIKAQASLEVKVKERTQEIQERNEELLALNEEIRQQSEEILAQRDALEAANVHITSQNDDIIASVLYAKRIQDALVPKREKIEKYFPELLLLYQPKDIVNGDFYWFTAVDSWKNTYINHDGLGLSIADMNYQQQKIIFLAVADCTGHGVPGAFMTVIGGGLLDQIINRDKIYSPAQILTELDKRLLRTLQQQNYENDYVQDGMDISLLQIDLVGKTLVWSSAKRPLWIVEQGQNQITVYKGDKYPIGSTQFKHKNFTEKEIHYKEGDIIYTFTDGYADQFGAQGKLTIRRFKEVLLEHCYKPFTQQEIALRTRLADWKGSEPQTDDILVVGLKL